MAVLLRALGFVVPIFLVRKPSNVSCDSACYSFNGEYVEDIKYTFIYPTLWQQRQLHGLNIRPKVAVQLLLLLAGDVETIPKCNTTIGPIGPILKCNTCQKTIRRNQQSQNCAICKDRFHESCMQDRLEDNGEMFYCKVCYTEPDNGINSNSSDNENLFAFLKQRLPKRT